MIVSFTNRFVFIAIPRTASGSVFQASRAAGAEQIRYRQAPSPCYIGDTNGFHDPFVPDELASYFTFTNCRNPYARMVSHYLFAKGDPPHRLHGLASNRDFAGYVDLAIMGRLLTTQTAFIGETRIDARIVQEGDVQAQLRLLPCFAGIPIEVGRVNVSTYDRQWWTYYDRNTIESVKQWAADDFANLQYSMDFADAIAGKPPEWYKPA